MNISKTKLAVAMMRKGYNFSQLAESAGVSRATLSYINCGKSCRADVVSRISSALEVDFTELLEVDGK